MPDLRTPRVTNVDAAPSEDARRHFAALLTYETDCWDVHHDLAVGDPGFVLLDVRDPERFSEEHVPGAVNLPHGRINDRNLDPYPQDTLFVTYCAGPHCNGADKAALKIAGLGRPVKKMIGGVEGWKDEGFSLAVRE